MNNPKYQIFQGNDNQYYFRLRAENGEIILASEGYVAKDGCENGIDSVKENAPKDERYRRKDSDDEQFYFNLVAANGEIIGTSEMYTTKQARDNGIEAVKKVAPDAPTEDLT
ncbi:MAG: YegP family protein [Candidatus Marinimicrobia bacterium]|nr:YegP family protein [Candidatus Neomarinimicrobiota bacterium]